MVDIDESFGKQHMLEIIDNYLAGKGILGGVSTWVENQLSQALGMSTPTALKDIDLL